jgi:DNA repair photolyase
MTTKETPCRVEDNGWSVAGCPIIYAPRGQAGEYAKLATNPYRGCGHKCAYCYVPSVLRITREEFDEDATPRENFMSALMKDARKYKACGITEQVMLSFTTDPFNPNDMSLTRPALETLASHGLAFCTLTKGGKRALPFIDMFRPDRDAFASTLTSLDDAFSLKWERGAALPGDRIATLKTFHGHGIFTWVSLEPTLNTKASLALIERTHEFVDLFKIGRANYLQMTSTTDWEEYTHRIVELVSRLGVRHYIKKDLQPFLPEGYYNPKYIPQNNANGVGITGRDEQAHDDAHQLELV